jgi:SAM-dependent methyltransferase
MAILPLSPAAERNREPILAVLRTLLPREAAVLEIAAGTGQHAAHFARSEPGWQWQPTDGDARALPGISAHAAGLANVRTPFQLDVLAWPGFDTRFDAVYSANMLHISPWATCAALMRGARQVLKPGGHLVVYGPFLVDGESPAPSNLAFDADLRERNAAWGLRRLGAVQAEAAGAGLAFQQRIDMPANNLILVFVS